MIKIGRQKITHRKLNSSVNLIIGDGENLPFEDDSFDAVTVAFGVRNFENLEKGLSEMNRVIKPGGCIAILEFSKPEKAPFKQLYFFFCVFINRNSM